VTEQCHDPLAIRRWQGRFGRGSDIFTQMIVYSTLERQFAHLPIGKIADPIQKQGPLFA
jgi:hypothetical protein